MPELTQAQEQAIQQLSGTIETPDFAAAFANAVSENVGRLVLVDQPIVDVKPLEEITAQASSSVQAGWTFSQGGQSADSGGACSILTLSMTDSATLLTLITGVPVTEDAVTDGMSALSPALEGIVRGFGIAVGNSTGTTVETDGFTCAQTPVSLGQEFLSAVQSD